MIAEFFAYLTPAFTQINLAISLFFSWTWFFWLFAILLPTTFSAWVYWRQLLYDAKEKYMLLELNIPREILKNPRGMEQVLKALHSMRNSPSDFMEAYWEGEKTRTFTFEIVSFGGELHFYIRTFAKYKALVEAAFFSYYPDVEIVEAEDFIKRLPANTEEVREAGYRIWGTELVLSKPAAYPIRTYLEFEAMDEELQFDPIASLMEILGKVKPGEFFGVQIVATPAAPDWKDKYVDLIKKIRQSKGAVGADQNVSALPLSPGETNVLKAIENNLSKPAFSCIIRLVYLSPNNLYYDSFARRGAMTIFNQYGSLNMNSFRANGPMATQAKIIVWPYAFPVLRTDLKQQRILDLFRNRRTPIAPFMGRVLSSHLFNWNAHSKAVDLNTEALATLFHPPMKMVLTAPHIKRVESRKAGPSSGLKIFGDEDALDRFK